MLLEELESRRRGALVVDGQFEFLLLTVAGLGIALQLFVAELACRYAP